MIVPNFSKYFIGFFIVVSIANILLSKSYASSQFAPTLEFGVTFLDFKQTGEDESGAATVISPGFNYLQTSPNSEISLSYMLESVNYSGLDRSDQNRPNLSLDSGFAHIPGFWKSEVNSSIQQVNDDINGIRSIGDDVFNDNTQELRTVEANTSLTGNLGSNLQYQSFLGADSADFENDNGTKGSELGLSIDSFRSGRPFTWGSALASQVEEEGNDTEQIDTLALNLRYRLNLQWQVFSDLTTWETDEDELSQESILVGMAWTPNPNTRVRVGVGEIENDETYSLDLEIKRRRTEYSATYTEGITSARSETLNDLDEDILSTLSSQSLSIDPVLQQRADVGISLQGIRSTFEFGLFDFTRDPIVTGIKEKGSGFDLGFSRRLSSMATMGVDISGERTELTETIDLAEIDIYYRKNQTKNMDWETNLNLSEQDSSSDSNDYEQIQLGFSVSMRF